jgi:hypothetical protein
MRRSGRTGMLQRAPEAASVNSPMRTIFLALLAALLLVPAAAHAADPLDILRDCADDDVLQGNYTLAELREAQKELPTDIDEYSPCRDVLARAVEAKTAKSRPDVNGGGQTGGGTSGGGGTSTGGGDTSGGPPGGNSSPVVGADSGREQPANPRELQALSESASYVDTGAGPRAVSPGKARLAADVGRNGMPTSMIAVLALLAAAAFAAAAPPLVRRGLARRQP